MSLISKIGKTRTKRNNKVEEVHAVVRFPTASLRIARHESQSRKPRIALYSHDTMGLGHMRRNLLIAQSLTSSPLDASVLMIAGACQISKFTLPAGADCLSLPSLCKNSEGEYGSRKLDVSLHELSSLRARTIRAALETFGPDMVIIDNVPRGAVGELDQSLVSLRGRTRFVLGLRDVLDGPNQVRREWACVENFKTIRDYYEAIWVYGDRNVYDLVREYEFPDEVARKVRFVGYLDQRARLQSNSSATEELASLKLRRGPLAVCSVGGGQDGVELAEAFARADLPRDFNAVLLTGPFMSAESRQRLESAASGNSRLRVIEFLAEPLHLLARADRLVSMGGYNTACEVLSLGIPWLVVPRTTPRVEQLVRAERLRELGLADFLLPKELSPKAIGDWLSSGPAQARNTHQIDLSGLIHLPVQAREIMNSSVTSGRKSFAEGGLKHGAL
jgi:predicted glycosyltransferase